MMADDNPQHSDDAAADQGAAAPKCEHPDECRMPFGPNQFLCLDCSMIVDVEPDRP